jgi:hypothetical protein
VDAWTVEDAVAMLSPELTAAEIRTMIELFAIRCDPRWTSQRQRGIPVPPSPAKAPRLIRSSQKPCGDSY